MSRGSRIAAGGAVLILSMAAALLLWPRPHLPAQLLEAVPSEATALAQVRVSRLVASPAFAELITERGLDARMQRVAKLCGHNPLASVETALIFALPEENSSEPQWGAIVRGDLDPSELAQCVKRTLQESGRKAKLKRDAVNDVPCVTGGQGQSRVCVLADGLIAGPDRAVRAALATMAGERPNVLGQEQRIKAWRSLNETADVRMVAEVPEPLRQTLTTLAQPFLPPALTPITRLRAGAGELHAGDKKLRGMLKLTSPDAQDAQTLATSIQGLLNRAKASPLLALTPVGALVSATHIKAEREHVAIRGEYPLHALGTLLDLLPAAKKWLKTSPTAPVPTPSPAAQPGTPTLPVPAPSPAPAPASP